MQDTAARVLSCETMAQDLVRIILSAPDIAAQAKAGQFIHILVPDSGHVLRRPISLMAADAAAGTLTLAIQPKGAGTQTLCACKPGETIRVLGPLGTGFDGKGAQCVYFVGGGVGVAPICCAMDAFATAESRAFFGFRTAAHAYGMTQALRGHGGQRRRLAGRARAGDEAAGGGDLRAQARRGDGLRPHADAGGGAGALRNIRRAVPALAGGADGLRHWRVSGLQRENHAAGRRLALQARLQGRPGVRREGGVSAWLIFPSICAA